MGFREKIIIFAVVPWIVALLTLFVITIPGINGVFGKLGETMVKETELNKLKTTLKEQKDVKDLKDAISQYEEELKGFNKRFPETDDLEPLYVDLQAALNKTDLTIQKLALSKSKVYRLPKNFWEDIASEQVSKGDKKGKKGKKKKKKKAKKGEKQLPPLSISTRTIKLDTTGDYSGVVELLYYLNNYYRFLALKNISIKTGGKLSATGISNPKDLKTTITFDVMTVKKNIIVPEKDEETDKKKAKKAKGEESSENKPANENTEKPANEG